MGIRRGRSFKEAFCLGATPDAQFEDKVSRIEIELRKRAALNPEPWGDFRVANVRVESSRTQKRIFNQVQKRKKQQENTQLFRKTSTTPTHTSTDDGEIIAKTFQRP